METKERVKIVLIVIRFLISIIGMIGNIILMISILKISKQLKTFEIMLLGLALSNLESIIIVDIYDLLSSAEVKIRTVICNTMKFLVVFGEVTTILFTVLISIFRYQKLRDAGKRVNLPILLDSVPVAMGASGVCVLLAIGFGVPTYAMDSDPHMSNYNHTGSCPLDFLQCAKNNCPVLNKVYKYIFLFICILLSVCVVTVTSSLILRTLLQQRRTVPTRFISSTRVNRKVSGFQRSTVAVLAGMTIFLLDWLVYLTLHLAIDPESFPFWDQTEFLIATTYSTASPYVYGAGNNLFSLKRCLSSGK